MAAASTARADEEELRRYLPSRADESWSWLGHPYETHDRFDPVKHLRLSSRRDDLFLTLGGETRQYLELFQNEEWGSTGVIDNLAWLQRYMLHGSLRLTRYLRAFVELKSGIEVGRLGGPRPVDEDYLDANQAFLDVDALPGRTVDEPPHLTLRIGRQELTYGSGRLLDVRDGPVNVRLSFDAVRILSRFWRMRVDAFIARPDKTNRGVFDDGWDAGQAFWGAWATLALPRLVVDAYYLGLLRQQAAYERGMGEELRHTVGARVGVHLKGPLLFLEEEGVYQFGRFAHWDISAWMFVFTATLRPPQPRLRPEITIGVGAASGDSNLPNGSFNTFNTLFPTGQYFGLLGSSGSPNHIAPKLALAMNLTENVRLAVAVMAFWRESTNDGIYNIPGFLVRPGVGNPGRYVGTQLEPLMMWAIDRHFSLNGTVAYFWVGDFFRASQPGKNITYGAIWAVYRF